MFYSRLKETYSDVGQPLPPFNNSDQLCCRGTHGGDITCHADLEILPCKTFDATECTEENCHYEWLPPTWQCGSASDDLVVPGIPVHSWWLSGCPGYQYYGKPDDSSFKRQSRCGAPGGRDGLGIEGCQTKIWSGAWSPGHCEDKKGPTGYGCKVFQKDMDKCLAYGGAGKICTSGVNISKKCESESDCGQPGCSTGVNTGRKCDSDSDCPTGYGWCVPGSDQIYRCDSGIKKTMPCSKSSQCPLDDGIKGACIGTGACQHVPENACTWNYDFLNPVKDPKCNSITESSKCTSTGCVWGVNDTKQPQSLGKNGKTGVCKYTDQFLMDNAKLYCPHATGISYAGCTGHPACGTSGALTMANSMHHGGESLGWEDTAYTSVDQTVLRKAIDQVTTYGGGDGWSSTDSTGSWGDCTYQNSDKDCTTSYHAGKDLCLRSCYNATGVDKQSLQDCYQHCLTCVPFECRGCQNDPLTGEWIYDPKWCNNRRIKRNHSTATKVCGPLS